MEDRFDDDPWARPLPRQDDTVRPVDWSDPEDVTLTRYIVSEAMGEHVSRLVESAAEGLCPTGDAHDMPLALLLAAESLADTARQCALEHRAIALTGLAAPTDHADRILTTPHPREEAPMPVPGLAEAITLAHGHEGRECRLPDGVGGEITVHGTPGDGGVDVDYTPWWRRTPEWERSFDGKE